MMQWIVSSGVLILTVIALRRVLRGRISLRMQYALWLLVLVRLLVPVSFGTSGLSVMNAVPERAPIVRQDTVKQSQTATVNENTITANTENGSTGNGNGAPSPGTVRSGTVPVGQPAERTDWGKLGRTVRLSGTAALGLVFLAVNLRFGRRLRRSRRPVENTGAELPVYETAETDTPCLFGLIRPAVYLTPETLADADALRYSLAHEQTHRRHGDNLWAVLRGVCLALHWYNPLVWWAAELSRRDAELACDEATIRRLGESERAAYGRTLIRMTCEKRPALLVTATMMTDSGSGLRERITLLVKKPKTAAYTAIAVLLVAGLSVACTFTGGRDNAELSEPFGKQYIEEAIVACAPNYMKTPIGGELEVLADRDANDVRTLLLRRMDNEEEQFYETVTEVTLTKEEFDVRFNSKTDGPTEWLDDGLSAAKLRRENAKAWLCTSSTADENGWANRVYFLQQKDGTLYLVMAAEQPENQNRNFVCWVFRLTEKPVPTYDSMEAYALSVINALKQPDGYTYHILPDGAQSSAGGTPVEVTEAAADVRVTDLAKFGDCAGIAPDGVLEAWRFSYEVKPEDKAGALPDRFLWVGGNNITDDGYISDGWIFYLIMLHTNDDTYQLLGRQRSNDGLWYNGMDYDDAYEYLYDFYADYAGLDVPRYLVRDFFTGLVSDPDIAATSEDAVGRRCDGDGWYLYTPTVVWSRTANPGEYCWYSGYQTGSTLRVDKSMDSVAMMKEFYRDNGFTLEQYSEGAALSGPWKRFDAESGTQSEMYLAANTEEGGCYIISTYWTPTDEVVTNQWGKWNKGAQVRNEITELRQMAQSFTVAPELGSKQGTSLDTALALASSDGALGLDLFGEGSLLGSYPVSSASGPDFTGYAYTVCDAPEGRENGLTLQLSCYDGLRFEFYEGTNVIAYFADGTDAGSYYTADGDFGISYNDRQTLYDRVYMWYSEAEFDVLHDAVGNTAIPNRGQTWEEAAQEYLDAYEGVHLRVRSGSPFRFTWMKNLVRPAEDMMQTKRERGELEENMYYFYSTTEFVPETELALGYAMAGNTGDCGDPDAPEGAYEYYRCCTIRLEDDGWHGAVHGTGW